MYLHTKWFRTGNPFLDIIIYEKNTNTKSDIAINPSPAKTFPIPTEIITDGTVITKNLHSLNLDQEWLEQQLKNSGVNSISEVFFAQVQTDGSLYIDVKQDQLH